MSTPSPGWPRYAFALGVVAMSTALCALLSSWFEPTNLVMIYLLGTLVVAARGARGPAALCALLGTLSFDFFFIPPYLTFRVHDIQYIWTMLVMFVVAMLISHLTVRVREKAEAVRQGEERSVWLMEKAKKAEIDAESERMRSSLLSSVSHDLRTPLAAILGSAGTLLEKKMIQGDARALLETIESEAERLSRLVQNLLEATRLESGAVAIQKSLYPLEEVIGSALEHTRKSLQGRRVDVKLPEDLPPVPVDPVLLEQVLVNLLENGHRHSPKTAPLTISSQTKDDHVQITVADQGPGLQPGEAERVFEKFYHGAQSKGAGLGLAICRAIVQAHGGRIWAENPPGGGAAFHFTIPLK